jgi:predicted HAD superfamily Cof-like phosphohydrolase
MTHFTKVSEFNQIFDFDIIPHDNVPLDLDNAKKYKNAKLRYDLIYEEGITELKPAFESNNRIEIADALADLLYVSYGALYVYNFNADKLLQLYAPYNVSPTENLNMMIRNLESTQNNYTSTDCQNRLIEMIETLKYAFFSDKDINKVKDILLRIIANTYNFAYILNIQIDIIFDLVHKSNMSKICISESEAKLTVKTYDAKYIQYKMLYDDYANVYGINSSMALSVYSPYDSPYYIKKSDNIYLIKNKSTGKALKSINYFPVDLKNCV